MIVRATLLHSFYDQYTGLKNEDAAAAAPAEDGVPPEDFKTALVRIAHKDRQNVLLKFDAFAEVFADRFNEVTYHAWEIRLEETLLTASVMKRGILVPGELLSISRTAFQFYLFCIQ